MPDFNAWPRQENPRDRRPFVGYAELSVMPESDMPDTTVYHSDKIRCLDHGLFEIYILLQTLDWICKREKGIVDVQPTSPPTGKPNSQCGSDSDGLWLEYEGVCYLFSDLAMVSYSTAQTVS